MEQEIITGNYYDKYNSGNPIVRQLMNGFIRELHGLVKKCGKPESLHILEAGCGEGHLAHLISKTHKPASYTGFDIDAEIIRQAQQANPDGNFHTGNIYDLNRYGSQNYDLVIASEVLEHIHHPEDALKQLTSLKAGFYLFSVPREPIWRILNLARLKYIPALGNTPGHLQHWSKHSFKKLISEYFRIEAVKSPFPWSMILATPR